MKIGFFWHSMWSGNLGVRALSYSNLLLVESIADELGIDTEYVLFGPRRKSDVRVSVNPILPRFRYVSMSLGKLLPWNFFRLLKEIQSCDLVLDIGAGDSFSDIYGSKRFLKILLSKILVGKGNKKLILSPQTIGPFKKHTSRVLAKIALKNVRVVYARDRESYEYCCHISPSTRVELSTDVAMKLPYETDRRLGVELNSNLIHVGINVSGLLCAGGYSGDNQFDLSVDYFELARDLVGNLLSIERVCVWLVPHVCSSSAEKLTSEDDYNAAQRIGALFEGAKVHDCFSDPIEAKNFISKLDFFIGSRMHATIAAFSSGVPVVALGYSRKFSGLYGSLGYSYSFDLTSMEHDEILTKTLWAFENRNLLKSDVQAGLQLRDSLLGLYVDGIKGAMIEVLNKQ